MISDNNSNRLDEELARLAAAGDTTAFDEIHNRHWYRSCENNTSIVVLGPQASSPARVEKNQFELIECLKNPSWLGWTRAGEDACGPRTTMLVLFSQLLSCVGFQILQAAAVVERT